VASGEESAWLGRLAEAMRSSIHRWDEVPARAAGLFFAGGTPSSAEAAAVLDEPGAREVAAALARVAADRPLDAAGWSAARKRVAEETGRKGKDLFRPLRVVITGEASGLELDRLVPLIEEGRRLWPDRIAGVAERAQRTAAGHP
jgi:hypothetical protein